MSRTRKLEDLCALAKLMADQAMAPLAQTQSRVAQAEERLEEIGQHRSMMQIETQDPVLAGLLARQSERLRHGQSRVLQGMAQTQAELELQKSRARPAVGRHYALCKLLQKERRAERLSQGRALGKTETP